MPPSSLPKVHVVDALMGSGKSTAAIRMMRSMLLGFDSPDSAPQRFMYITPFLAEIDRIKDAVTAEMGDGRNHVFAPEAVDGKKLEGLNKLLLEGRNIVATHAIFQHVDGVSKDALEDGGYTLIVDEVASWVEQYPISSGDLQRLFRNGDLVVNTGTGRVDWVDLDGRPYTGKFEGLRKLCLLGKITPGREMLGRDQPDEEDASEESEDASTASATPVLLLWHMPVETLSAFQAVYVLTHMFEGSDMSAYFRLHSVEVVKMGVSDEPNISDRRIIPYDPRIEARRVEAIRPLLKVLDNPRLNAIGERPPRSKANPLSKSWFTQDARNGEVRARKLASNIKTYFRSILNVKSGDALWSTFKSRQKLLAAPGFARGFLPCNARATNDYGDRTALAYCLNLFHHPFIRGYFQDNGVTVNQDAHALSVLTQWIWRSAIRNGQPVTLYLPSARMRKLLADWLRTGLPPGSDSPGSPTTTTTPRPATERVSSHLEPQP